MSDSPPSGLYFLLAYFKLGQPKTRLLGETFYSAESDDDPIDGLFAEHALKTGYTGDTHDLVFAFDASFDTAGVYHKSSIYMVSYSAKFASSGIPMWRLLEEAENDPVRQTSFFIHFKQKLAQHQHHEESVVIPLKKN